MTQWIRLLAVVLALFVALPHLFTAHAAPVAGNVAKRRPLLLDADRAPPTEQVFEIKPAENADFFWVDGYWGWNGKSYVWQAGHLIKQNPGHVWVASTWAKRGKKWHFYPGHWEKEDAEETEESTDELAEHEEAAAPDAEGKPAPGIVKPKKKVKKPESSIYFNERVWPRATRR